MFALLLNENSNDRHLKKEEAEENITRMEMRMRLILIFFTK